MVQRERKAVSIQVRATAAQKAELVAAATFAGTGLSTYLLMAGLRAARNGQGDETAVKDR